MDRGGTLRGIASIIYTKMIGGNIVDGTVKFIFKTLVKVPIYILVSYLIFNVFAFGLSYFKMLGLSYVAMQTAVENNFIPDSEKASLEAYMNDTLETEILSNVQFTEGTNTGTHLQYGDTVTVGVQAHYNFIWPLQPKEQHAGGDGGTNGNFGANTDGMNNSGSYTGDKTDAQLEEARDRYNSDKNNIVIEYKVPGLKYYPDTDMPATGTE